MIGRADIRVGLNIMFNDQPCHILDFKSIAPGRGPAYTNTKLKNLWTGVVFEHQWKGGENYESIRANVEPANYLFSEGVNHTFMNKETFEQFDVTAEKVGAAAKWLAEGVEVDVLMVEGKPLAILLPKEVTLTVNAIEQTDSNPSTNQATLENGTIIAVPKSVQQGDRVTVNTATGIFSK